MNANLRNYEIIPSVVEADKETEITVRSLDGGMLFFDDVTYDVQVIPKEESDVPMNEAMTLLGWDEMRTVMHIKPVNRELKFKYHFIGEQEWNIHISTKEYAPHVNPLYEHYVPHWNPLIHAPEQGVLLSVYSLYTDLYNRRPLKGDLHIHSLVSDGSESPSMVATEYRRAGYDFISITDHNIYHGSKEAEKDFDFETDFKMLVGEEIHNGYVGFFHMVNINGAYSINDIYIKEPERVNREAMALEAEVDVPENIDKKEYLHRVWLYREMKKSGGFAIYPHPYWTVGKHYHTETKMSEYILKNGLCDAFEVLGGCSPKELNMQVALYNELRAEGVRIPVVGSTDSHSVLNENSHFKDASTVVFTEGEDITGAISENMSVAVETYKKETARAYGPFRLVKYVHFLLENYYPVHDALCHSSAEVILGYIRGEKELKSTVEILEKRILAFEKKFFGRE